MVPFARQKGLPRSSPTGCQPDAAPGHRPYAFDDGCFVDMCSRWCSPRATAVPPGRQLIQYSPLRRRRSDPVSPTPLDALNPACPSRLFRKAPPSTTVNWLTDSPPVSSFTFVGRLRSPTFELRDSSTPSPPPAPSFIDLQHHGRPAWPPPSLPAPRQHIGSVSQPRRTVAASRRTLIQTTLCFSPPAVFWPPGTSSR